MTLLSKVVSSTIGSKIRIVSVCMGIVCLFVHFTLTSLYTYKSQLCNTRAGYLSQAYAYPFFQQSWGLFAPAPKSNYHLYVQFEQNGVQKTDLYEEVVTQHQSNRLKGYGHIVMAFTNAIHFFEYAATTDSLVSGFVGDNQYFSMIGHSAMNYLRYTRRLQIEKLKMVLVIRQVDSGETKTFYN